MLVQQLGASERHIGYLLLHDFVGEEVRHPVDDCEPQSVNIAVRLLEDTHDDRFDTAMVTAGDSDLVPPVKSVQGRFPDERVVVAAPPKRWSAQLGQAATRRGRPRL